MDRLPIIAVLAALAFAGCGGDRAASDEVAATAALVAGIPSFIKMRADPDAEDEWTVIRLRLAGGPGGE